MQDTTPPMLRPGWCMDDSIQKTDYMHTYVVYNLYFAFIGPCCYLPRHITGKVLRPAGYTRILCIARIFKTRITSDSVQRY